MANLKMDLLNKVNNEKYFEELELVRLAQEPNMNYKQKIEEMDAVLGNIAMLNAKLGGVEQYFRDEAPAAPAAAPEAPATPQPPVAAPQGGQTHRE